MTVVSGAAVMVFILALIVFVAVFVVVVFNGLVRLRNQVKNAWSQIDVQLKRRHDLIPNLVETAKGYMTHERDTLENITKARNLATQASGVKDQAQAESGLNNALSNFFLVVENYPDLKANQNFLALQEELTSTENKIGFSRQFYNDQVMHYNNRIEMFPSNIIAGMFNFERSEFFEIENEAERAVPQVKFS
jgi:LemA protein